LVRRRSYVDYGDDFTPESHDVARRHRRDLRASAPRAQDFGFALVVGARGIDLKVSVALNPGRRGREQAIADPFVGVEYCIRSASIGT
jgi:hypothetical protein